MQLLYLFVFVFFVLLFIPISERLIAVGGLLFVVTLAITVMIANIFGAWFSLILFLIYVTGLLVLISYLLALRPNPRQAETSRVVTFTSFLVVTVIITSYCSYHGFIIPNIDFEGEVSLIFCIFNITVYWLIALILLAALIIVVSLCFKVPSPLRSFL